MVQVKYNAKKKQFISFLHSINEGFVLIDKYWRIVDLNTKAWLKMGYAIKQHSIGKKFMDVFPSVRKTRRAMVYQSVMQTGHPAILDEEQIENESGVRFLNIYIHKIGNGIGIIASDVTERVEQSLELKRRTEQLVELTAHLQSAREQERTAIAREIHDSLGQALTAMKYDLHLIHKKLNGDFPELREKSKKLISISDEMIEVVRNITSRLRLEYLETHPFNEALRLKTRDFEKLTGIDIYLSIEQEEEKISKEIAVVLYRILQEALTNIARHSGANKTVITFSTDENSVRLSIQDNGRGISKEDLESRISYGIIGMRERCSYLKGKLDITGKTGKGTLIEVILPVL